MKASRRSLVLIGLGILFSGVTAFAQSNDRVDELLSQAQAHYGITAYIALSAGKEIDESSSVDEAFQKLKDLGWISPSKNADDPVSIQDLSYILMKSLGLKGGLMYSLFPGPRYAYRELAYAESINVSGGPFRLVSGEEVLRVTRYVTERKGQAQ